MSEMILEVCGARFLTVAQVAADLRGNYGMPVRASAVRSALETLRRAGRVERVLGGEREVRQYRATRN